jgi:hypothetical protein
VACCHYRYPGCRCAAGVTAPAAGQASSRARRGLVRNRVVAGRDGAEAWSWSRNRPQR